MAQASTSNFRIYELVIDLTGKGLVDARLVFYKIPRYAMNQVGKITIDWGDEVTEDVDCTITDAELQQMAADETFTATLTKTHRLQMRHDLARIRICTSSGWLPLKELPKETESIVSALPTLTIGETTAAGELIAAKVFPPLVSSENGERTTLKTIAANLFVANPDLEVFDRAFFASSIETVDADLFSPIHKIASIRELFAKSAIKVIPLGFLENATEETLCSRAFAECTNLEKVENPFEPAPIPYVVDDFLLGAHHALFSWADATRRQIMGWTRPKATKEDAAFRFTWKANTTEQTVLRFYPIDLEIDGDFLIDWGDGVIERFEFETTDAISHAWKKLGLYNVTLYSPKEYAVRPFRFSRGVVAILDPLPNFHPKALRQKDDFVGWAANLRELESIAPHFFDNNPTIRNLEQCFAGCTNLKAVDDDIILSLKHLECADAMFAFCYKLERLPKSFANFPRQTGLDCFAESGADLSKGDAQ